MDAPDTSLLIPATTLRAPLRDALHRMPEHIGGYHVLGILGRGGMGVVYRAVAEEPGPVPVGQEIAIKVLRDATPQARARFAREAAYLEKLRHPNIVRVYEAGELDGQPFIVMQLAEGRHGDRLVQRVDGVPRGIDQRQAAEIAVQALDALASAHRQGLLHRDVKPGNIIIGSDGVVRLVDFGLAQLMVLDEGLTASGAVVGTPAYMSPEQASGERERIGPRSDLYSLGASLYELLTGRPPFIADNPMAVLAQVVGDTPEPPRRLRPDLSPALETVVLRAMVRDPRNRYPSADAMADDLRRWLRGERIRASRPGLFHDLAGLLGRGPRSAALLGLIFFVGASGIVLAFDTALTRRKEPAATKAEPVANTPVDAPQEPATWTPAWSYEGPLPPPAGQPAPPVVFKPFPGDKAGLRYADLPTVNGPVRLATEAAFGTGDGQIELLICDPDVGAGYRLHVETIGDNLVLNLLRARKVMMTRTVARPAPSERVVCELQRNDGTVTVAWGDDTTLVFHDLQPIADLDGNATSIACAGSGTLHAVRLERQRGLLVDASIAQGDALRVAGRHARAKNAYETYLSDHAESPLRSEIELRSAICDRELGNYEQALERCITLASANRDNPDFVRMATFQAFLCTLRLRRYQDAGEYLTSLLRDQEAQLLAEPMQLYDPRAYQQALATALAERCAAITALAPGDRIRELADDLQRQGERSATDLPSHAIDCFANSELLAVQLNLPALVRRARNWRGDVLRGQDRYDEAALCYETIIQTPGESAKEIGWATVKLAQIRNLMNDVPEAERLLRALLSTPDIEDAIAQIARLHLGDILAQHGDTAQALAVWRSSTGVRSVPGRIMRALVEETALPTPADIPSWDNDLLYFSARQIALGSAPVAPGTVHRILMDALARRPAWEWPAPLIKQWLKQLDAMPATPLMPPAAEHTDDDTRTDP